MLLIWWRVFKPCSYCQTEKPDYLPGTDGTSDNYIEGFKGLKGIKYKGLSVMSVALMVIKLH